MKPKDHEKTIARVTIEVQIVKGVQYYGEYRNESEEYVCVRDAKVVASQALGPTGILTVLEEGYFEEPDPDNLMIEAVQDALTALGQS